MPLGERHSPREVACIGVELPAAEATRCLTQTLLLFFGQLGRLGKVKLCHPFVGAPSEHELPGILRGWLEHGQEVFHYLGRAM